MRWGYGAPRSGVLGGTFIHGVQARVHPTQLGREAVKRGRESNARQRGLPRHVPPAHERKRKSVGANPQKKRPANQAPGAIRRNYFASSGSERAASSAPVRPCTGFCGLCTNCS